MLKRFTFKLFALMQVLLLASLLVGVTPATPAQAAAVRIMPLGDSITGSPGCWRALLWNRLQNSGYTNIDFVGTLPPQGCAIAYDGDNEGHGGILATNMANQNQLPPWLAATNPDIVLMHLGTNDVWSNIAPATILAAFSTLVDQMRANNPNVKIIVAQILPMNPSNCADCGQRVINFNAAIPGWASSKSTSQSPITVVDQWTGFNTATDTGDGVHPNDAGNQKMSDKWYPALSALLTPGTGATATRTPTQGTGPTATRTRTPVLTGTPTHITQIPQNTATRTRTPTRTPTGSCVLPTPESLRVSPVTSPVSATTQVITVTLNNGVSVTVTSEAGSFTSTTPSGGVFSVTINLVPNSTNHLQVQGTVNWSATCAPYMLSTSVDTSGNPLTIVQNSGGPTATRTPTIGPSLTPTRTPTLSTGDLCSPVTSTITAPFTFDGAGTFCWQSSNLGSYTNNWNLVSLRINGVNFTGQYVASGSYPAKINGFWYVSYSGNFPWSHFEAK